MYHGEKGKWNGTLCFSLSITSSRVLLFHSPESLDYIGKREPMRGCLNVSTRQQRVFANSFVYRTEYANKCEQQRRNRTCSEPYYWTPFKRHSNDVFIPIYLPRFSISSLFFHRFFFYFININVTHSSIQMVCLNFQSENVSIKSDKKGNKITFCMKLHTNIAIG